MLRGAVVAIAVLLQYALMAAGLRIAPPTERCDTPNSSSCGDGILKAAWLPLLQLDGFLLSGSILGGKATAGIIIASLGGLTLIVAIIYFVLVRSGIISPVFAPAGVKVIHNPLVRRPMEIFAEVVDLEEIAKLDPGISAVAGALGFGMGIKGGIARKMLKILHGAPEPVTNDFDIDAILLAEHGLTPAEETELRKAVTGMQLGQLVLEPKDVEVIRKEELKTYWITRDICLNEVLLLRLSPGAPLTLFYSADALSDAANSVIRSIPHALKSDFTECWILDGEKPVLSAKHVARTILRFFKGHGDSYQFDEATWNYYRRTKLSPITLFQILRSVHANDEKYKEVVTHLIDVGLLSGYDVRQKGGFNGLWGETLKEVNDKMAQFGGRLSLDDLDADAVEAWIVQKKSRMRSLPYRHRERASRTGSIPADEDTLSLGLVSFPQQLLDFIEQEGGLWDPEHPEGRPPSAPAPRSLVAALLAAPRTSGPAVPVVVDGACPPEAAQPAYYSSPPAGFPWRPWHWLASLSWGSSSKSAEPPAATGTGLTEPLLAQLQPSPPSISEAIAANELRRQVSAVWEGGESEGVHFIHAQALVGAAPAVPAGMGRLGMAWLLEGPAAAASTAKEREGEEAGAEGEGGSERHRAASRYSGGETILFMCRIAARVWPLLLISSLLIVAAVGLHLYQLRVQSNILNAAVGGKKALFLSSISLLAKLSLTGAVVNWLSNVVLQQYLRLAMQHLYTGLFQHVLFQDITFYDSISTSELATRTGVDAMNIRVLVGFLVQKLVKGLTQVLAGVTLLVIYAGPMLNSGLASVFVLAVGATVAELVLVSVIIRNRHRVARSMLGRLYGFAYDVFSSIQGVIAMALQRSFTDTYTSLVKAYFHAAMVLSVCVSSHQFFLELVFSAVVTVAILYIGGESLLNGTTTVGTVYALLRYSVVVEQGYIALSEAVARFFASYGSLEHVIDLHERGHLTNLGKPAVLEALEREDAEREEAGSADPGWPNWTRRLTAASWAGGMRCRDIIYGYKGKPGNALFLINLDLRPGQAVLVSGDTGSGRSTLMHLLHLDVSAGGGSLQFQAAGGTWLTFHPTSTDRYDMQQRMGYASPGSAFASVFFATVQENMVCACTPGHLPSVADCQRAATMTGFDADVAQLPDGYQTLVGDASKVDLVFTARLRLSMARLLLLERPQLVLIDDADRFCNAVPRFPEVLTQLREGGAMVVLTANTSSTAGLRAVLPGDVRPLVLEGGRLRPAAT